MVAMTVNIPSIHAAQIFYPRLLCIIQRNRSSIEATLYGSGGVGGLGSIRGTINASGLLFSLFVGKQEEVFALCREISLWYEKASLPAYRPGTLSIGSLPLNMVL